MIARLYGKLILKQPPMLLIDVHGVGYEVEAPMSTFYELPEPGENVTLLTHLTIRDDAHILFGFASEGERSLFRNPTQDRLGDADGVICVAGHLSDIASNPASDAISALVALGYKQADADRMVKVVARDGMPSEEIIREALKAQVR